MLKCMGRREPIVGVRPWTHLALVATASCLLFGCAGPAVPGGPGETLPALVEQTDRAGPGRDSPDYGPPTPAEASAVAVAVTELMAGHDTAAPAGYRLTAVDDQPLTALVEVPRSGRVPGNGMYVARPGGRAGTVVQVPHPVADTHTEELGAELFVLARADVFMLAGAHRTAGGGSADVAHRADSTFAAVDEKVVGPDSVVVQLHGFAEDDHSDAYGDVVLSSTVDEPTPLVRTLGAALADAGYSTCVYDGEHCGGLAGTRNVQAEHARSVGAEFIHLEVADGVREDPVRRTNMMRIVADVLDGA